MRRALRDFFTDLIQGDPVALIIAGVVLFLASLVAIVWIIDRRKKKKEIERKKKPDKRRPQTS
ncbi:MAG: hypothetical protein HY040_02215 [Planctomycetes bacterium]|nr:hypothetical protein [Planctomycetota bacterium]